MKTIDCKYIINQLSIDNYRKHFKGIEEKYIHDIIDTIKDTLDDTIHQAPWHLFEAIEDDEYTHYMIKRRAYKVLKSILNSYYEKI